MENKYKKKQFIIFLLFLVFLFLGVIFLNIGINSEKVERLQYKENNDIDYKVYLKPNDYFEKEYIEKGKTYITSLIDHIQIDFNYNVEFDQEINTKYNYKVVAKIEANKTDNNLGNYWTKEYDISDSNEMTMKNTRTYTVMKTIDVDYNKYNDYLNEFKKSVGLTNLDGLLYVYLTVTSDIKKNAIETPIESKLMLKLPLSELAIEGTIESDINNNTKVIKQTVKQDGPLYLFLGGLGASCITFSIILLWILGRNKKVFKINNEYELELKRILTTYDSIIVNIKDLPDLKKYNVIKVESFNELIDAHSEVRMPINYYQHEDYSAFLLCNENTAWRYVLLKGSKKRSAENEK